MATGVSTAWTAPTATTIYAQTNEILTEDRYARILSNLQFLGGADGLSGQAGGAGGGAPWIPAGAFELGTATFPGIDKHAFTGHVARVLRFDPGTGEEAYVQYSIPTNVVPGTVTVNPVWFGTATGGQVRWELTYFSASDDAAISSGSTAAVEAVTPINANQLDHASITLATAGIASGETLFLKLRRDASNSSDTYAQDALLLGMRLNLSA